MTRTLPTDAIELLNGRHEAASIAEACLIAYWMHRRDQDAARMHFDDVHKQFVALAEALGYDIAEWVDDKSRITALEGFIADFAAADFPAIRTTGMYHPEDEPDEVTELAPIEAWQDDARALIATQPAMQEAAE